MMMWIAFAAITAIIFFVLVFFGKMPRGGVEMTGSALCIALAGYVWQGSPHLPDAPKIKVEKIVTGDDKSIEERNAISSGSNDIRGTLIMSDSFARRGKFEDAAKILDKSLERFADNSDIWLALGNALVGHSEGQLVPAADYAYKKAAALSPKHPGPPYFYGLALLTSGRVAEAQRIWQLLLNDAPENAEWRTGLEEKLDILNEVLAEQANAAGSAPNVNEAAPMPMPMGQGGAQNAPEAKPDAVNEQPKAEKAIPTQQSDGQTQLVLMRR